MERWLEKTAVVTGASEGIGAAIVRRLAKDGMKVAALARRRELLQALEDDVKNSGAKGTVKGYVCDVAIESQVEATFKSIEEDFGAIHVLINNAGVFKSVLPTDMDLQNSKQMIDTNIIGLLNCTKAGLEVMKKHSIHDGHVINTSSIAAHGKVGIPNAGIYAASKTALNVIASSLRDQLRKENSWIRVTNVSPGLVKTPLVGDYAKNMKLGQYMEADDVADAIAFVLSSPAHVNVSEIILENIEQFMRL